MLFSVLVPAKISSAICPSVRKNSVTSAFKFVSQAGINEKKNHDRSQDGREERTWNEENTTHVQVKLPANSQIKEQTF